ncbi:hypothetical protein ACKKBG_A29840 [Auxenochlorella protothecoides x Auxenochlorella symbiontica]
MPAAHLPKVDEEEAGTADADETARELEEEEEDAETASCASGEGLTDDDTDASQPTGTGKKKRKKKKKKANGEASSEASRVDAEVRKQQQERVSNALADVRANSSGSIWVDLSSAAVDSKTVKKLCAHLAANTEILSLNLAGNCLDDESAESLARALAQGAAPNLIDLDLRDNPLSPAAEASVRATLKERKILNVELGPLPAPVAAPPAEAGKEEAGKEGGASLSGSLRDNPYVRRFFQVDEDDQDEGQALESPTEQVDPEQLSAELWEQVNQALESPTRTTADLATPLAAIADQVRGEMDSCMLPMLADTELADLRPFTAAALRALPTLRRVLGLASAPRETTFSRTAALRTLGLHRAAALELLAQVLRAECGAVARAVVHAPGCPLALGMRLALAHEACSPAQGAVLRAARAALAPGTGAAGLWRQLVSGAAGEGGPVGEVPGEEAEPQGETDAREGDALDPAPPTAIAELCAKAADLAPGLRSPGVGWALALAGSLHAAMQPGYCGEEGRVEAWQEELREALAGQAAWVEFAAAEGPLADLLVQQQGDLAGPKPARMVLPEPGAEPSRVLSGQDLINMLRGLHGSPQLS